MAHSEYEKATLEQIGRDLGQDYPRLAAKLGPAPLRPMYRTHARLGLFTAVVGTLVLWAALAVQALPLGVLGFILMGTGTYLATIRIVAPPFLRRNSPRPGSQAGMP